MAIMIPNSVRENTKSRAEKRLFNRFKSELDDDTYVLHSLGLKNHNKKIWAECDFVIISKLGIYVIEVKGGGVSCRNGEWIFTGKNGTFNKKEGPFEQAKTAMYAIKDIMVNNYDRKNWLIGYGVIMPDEYFNQEGPEIELNVLLDKTKIKESLVYYLRSLNEFWTRNYSVKHGIKSHLLNKKEIESIRNQLRPEIRTALTLNSHLTSIEQDQIELTREQINILKRIENNPRTLICGAAGTGKTILAIENAINFAKKGKKVLYLCYNRLLGNHIKGILKDDNTLENLYVESIHHWFYSTIKKAGLSNILEEYKNHSDYFNYYFPSIYMDALIESEFEPFDVLIVDEAQDLLKKFFIDAFDLTLKNGLDQGFWHFFYDPLQNIFKGIEEQAITRLQDYGCANYSLTINCRNTKKVAVNSSLISGITVPFDGITSEGFYENYFVENSKDLVTKLEKKINKLMDQNVNPKDIILLSGHKLQKSSISILSNISGYKINDLTENIDNSKVIDFCTFQAFKGLERKIVIAFDFFNLEDVEAQLLHYCALTRARMMLITFLSVQEKTTYERFAGDFGTRMSTVSKGKVTNSDVFKF